MDILFHWPIHYFDLTKIINHNSSLLPMCDQKRHFSGSLKRKCCHFDKIFITGCTGSCQNDNFQCSQWWKFHQNNNISVSVILRVNGKWKELCWSPSYWMVARFRWPNTFRTSITKADSINTWNGPLGLMWLKFIVLQFFFNATGESFNTGLIQRVEIYMPFGGLHTGLKVCYNVTLSKMICVKERLLRSLDSQN